MTERAEIPVIPVIVSEEKLLRGTPGETLEVEPGGEDDPVYSLQEFVVLHTAGGSNAVHQVPLNVLRNVNKQDAPHPAGRENEDVAISGQFFPLSLVQHHNLAEEDAGVGILFPNICIN